MLTFIYLLAATGATANAAYAVPPPPLVIKTPPVVMVPTISLFPEPPKGKESPPIPKANPGGWASTLDYPALALREEREGTTAFTLAVDKDGRVSECIITTSSGHTDLDQATCANIQRRAVFHPAQDKKGAPTVGRYSNRVRWQIPSISTFASLPIQNNSYPRAPQLENAVNLRIAKEEYPPAALVALQEGISVFNLDIDDSGKVRNCAITSGSGAPDLDRQSCIVAQKWQFNPARDLNGMPVAGRTSHNIRWRLPKGALSASPSTHRPPPNPFEKVGTMTMTFDFDKEGKLSDCAFEHKGETGIFGAPPNLSEDVCKTGFGKRDVQPFVDASGNPQPRRVVVKISVDHEEISAGSAGKQTAQK